MAQVAARPVTLLLVSAQAQTSNRAARHIKPSDLFIISFRPLFSAAGGTWGRGRTQTFTF
jgi:hypothetical protein